MEAMLRNLPVSCAGERSPRRMRRRQGNTASPGQANPPGTTEGAAGGRSESILKRLAALHEGSWGGLRGSNP